MIDLGMDRFEELVAAALDDVPPRFASAMRNVAVLADDIDPDNPHLLGLYRGVALPERTSHYSGVLPDTITIYRLPILRICGTEEEVRRQVAVTVVHEIGHHFGVSEQTLRELGWG